MNRASDRGATAVSATVVPAIMTKFADCASDEVFRNPQRSGVASSVIKLKGGTSVFIPVSIVGRDTLVSAKGNVIRVHVWIKGEDTGIGGDLWNGAPQVSLLLKDAYNDPIGGAVGNFRTRGSFPWFCYYIDVQVPAFANFGAEEETAAVSLQDDEYQLDFGDSQVGSDGFPEGAGLYMALFNPLSGIASFADISWEIVKKETQPGVDPIWGSRAPNPRYDELPMHVFCGLDDPGQTPWSFLAGNKAYASVLTVDGLRHFLESSQNDWFAMYYGVAQLLELKNCSDNSKNKLDFEDGWTDTLAAFIRGKQDAATGLWLIDGEPDVMVSFMIARKLFAPSAYARVGEVPFETPYFSIDGGTLKYADKIIATLLENRSGAVWNQYAFTKDENVGGAFRNTRTQLGTTCAAIGLLRLAADATSDEALKENALKAIDEAVAYVMENLVRADGLWLQNSDDAQPTSPAFMSDLIEASRLLEYRVAGTVPVPEVTGRLNPAGSKMTVNASPLADGQNSIRVYSVLANTENVDISKGRLLAILQAPSSAVASMDPVRALQKLMESARRRWGGDMTWKRQGAYYTDSRLSRLASVQNATLKPSVVIDIPALASQALVDEDGLPLERRFYAVAVNGVGEASEPVLLATTGN